MQSAYQRMSRAKLKCLTILKYELIHDPAIFQATSDIHAHHASISAIVAEWQKMFRSDAADATKEWLQYVEKARF